MKQACTMLLPLAGRAVLLGCAKLDSMVTCAGSMSKHLQLFVLCL